MRIIVLVLIISFSLYSANFSQSNMPGVWEISSPKSNGTISFGKDIGKQRGDVWQLLFNPQGMLKVVNTGSVYNYEIIGGKLKIYETKVYRNDYKIKQKHRYDLFKITKQFEGCHLMKVVTKKITGLKKKEGMKICKVEQYPQPIVQRSSTDYKF